MRFRASESRAPISPDEKVSHNQKRDSEINLVNLATGKPFPCAPAKAVVLSSVSRGWRGIIVERHHLMPQEMPEHYVMGHGISVSTSQKPISFGWKDGDRRRDGVLNPGDFHLLPHREGNAPRWLQMFDQVSMVLDPHFVADVVREGLPPEKIQFATQRSASDGIIRRYCDLFLSELATDSPKGRLYVDTLCVGLSLHLLSNYALVKPKIPLPRGKLNSFQLRNVVDFVLSHLDEDVSLLTLAEQAHISPFHFARLFRATILLTPHQFVLQQRIQRSINLIKKGKLPMAQIAVESGFYDQAHFTRAFQRFTGKTPAQYSLGR